VRSLVFLAAFFASATAVAKPGYGEIGKAIRAIEQQRIEDGAKLVADLAADSPNDAEVRYLQAQVAFLRGDYDGAQKLLAALDDPRTKVLVKQLLPLVKSTADATRGFEHRDSPKGYFTIYYPAGKDVVLVDLAGEALDAAHERIGADFGWHPTEKVRVEILPRITDLARVSTLTEKDIQTSGTIALCKYNKLMIVSPRATVFGYPWMDTLVHEYTHYVISRVTEDRMPIWLHEGLAKFQESRWRAEPHADGLGRSYEHFLALALKKGRLITFEEMHPSMALLPSQEAAATAFAEVYTIVAFLEKKVGYAGIREIFGKIREGKSERRAVAEVYGGSWDEVESAWRKHLKTLNLKTDPAYTGQKKLRFQKTESSDENVGVDQISEEKARKHARLGGLLRARGRLAAAAIEYERARAAAPEQPFVGAKLARTYLELDDFEKAIAVAEPLVAKDPEDVGARATLGVAYLKTGSAEKAEVHLTAAVRQSPFDPAVRCGLAEAYGALGRSAEATRETSACAILAGQR
jgi:tetratricopeptide (TPR) repeat protein